MKKIIQMSLIVSILAINVCKLSAWTYTQIGNYKTEETFKAAYPKWNEQKSGMLLDAAYYGNAFAVKFLLDQGAQVNVTDLRVGFKNHTPLYYAIYNGKSENNYENIITTLLNNKYFNKNIEYNKKAIEHAKTLKEDDLRGKAVEKWNFSLIKSLQTLKDKLKLLAIRLSLQSN